MNPILYGSVRDKLVANGYLPTSALRPGLYGWKVADDPAAVVCAPGYFDTCDVPEGNKRTVAALHVITKDVKARAAIVAVLAKRGIKDGPIRTDAGGNLAYIVRLDDDYHPPWSQEVESAFAVSAVARDSVGKIESAIIRVDGEWTGGDLLTVPRAKLPGIADKDALDAIVGAVREVVSKHSLSDYVYELPKFDPDKPEDPFVHRRKDMLPASRDRRGGTVFNPSGGLGHREAARLAALGIDE